MAPGAGEDEACAGRTEQWYQPGSRWRHQHQQSAGFAGSSNESRPPLNRQQCRLVADPFAGRQDEERRVSGHRPSDLVQSEAVAKPVRQPRRVLAPREGVDRREFSAEVSDRDAARC